MRNKKTTQPEQEKGEEEVAKAETDAEEKEEDNFDQLYMMMDFIDLIIQSLILIHKNLQFSPVRIVQTICQLQSRTLR